MHDSRRFCAGVLTVLIAAPLVGVAVTPNADHDGDHAHVEHAHGGHEHLLHVDEARLRCGSAELAIQPAVAAPLIADLGCGRPTAPDHREHELFHGRDPPTCRLARPPPLPS